MYGNGQVTFYSPIISYCNVHVHYHISELLPWFLPLGKKGTLKTNPFTHQKTWIGLAYGGTAGAANTEKL